MSAATRHKARPTEYAGVVFKSKSEAQVALYLDLRLSQQKKMRSAFRYEPSFLKVDDYVPDFLLHFLEPVHGQPHVMESSWKIVEYKPSQVTETYRDELAGRFEKVMATDFVTSIRSAYGAGSVECELWEGNFYDAKTRTWRYTDPLNDPDFYRRPFDADHVSNWAGGYCSCTPDGWCAWSDDYEDEEWELIKAVRNHRFDLKR
jgi:hypothetical protein